MKFKISVIVPIYGVEKFIGHCVESLMQQTLKEVEYIFVNDCTKDSSINILQSILKKYPTVISRIINKEKNEGLPLARKSGLEKAQGEYIFHMDSDDWLESNGLEKMYEAVKISNADVLCCGFTKDYSDHSEICLGEPVISASSAIDMMLNSEKRLHSGVWAKLIRRELFEKVAFPPTYMHEDLALMIQIFYYAKSVSYLPQAFYHYRQDNTQSMIRQNKNKRNLSAVNNFHFIIDFMKRVGIEAEHRKNLMYRINGFKTFSLVEGRLLDKTLYPESNSYIFSCNSEKRFMPKFYTYCAIHHCSFIWLFQNNAKIFLKKIIRKK